MSEIVTQAELRFEDRTECNHFFKWDPESKHWKTTRGQTIFVCPPSSICKRWVVIWPSNNKRKEIHSQNPEFAAFSEADLWSRRK
jgi:hypothetical protein